MIALEAPTAIDVSHTARVSFGRLVSVELRKMVDTRAGRWLLSITVGLLVVAMAIAIPVAVLNDLRLSFDAWLQILSVPMSLLLPTVAIISITQEWGQRTALTTFALEPGRMRVVLAKLVCVMALAVGTLVVAGALAVLGNVLFEVFSPMEAGWQVEWQVLGWTVFTQLAYFVMAFGFGMAFLNTPAAIVLYYVVSLLLPMMVYGPIYALVSWGPDVIPWIDLGMAVAPFTDPGAIARPDQAVAQVVTTFLAWVVAPFVVGAARIRRVELK
ncbi:MAG: hypothetical protein LT071_11060 [Nocardioides sp.]|nr:hypothetical protein [Nocardioides sp.]